MVASAAYALPANPTAANDTPAKRSLFILLPQALVFRTPCWRPCETIHACGNLSSREQGNRYGLLHRFIKKKYMDLRLRPCLLSNVSVAFDAAAIGGKICGNPRKIPDIGQLFLIIF
jgi:hypothetical protein